MIRVGDEGVLALTLAILTPKIFSAEMAFAKLQNPKTDRLDYDAIIDLYQSDYTIYKISQETGLNPGSIYSILKNNNIKTRRPIYEKINWSDDDRKVLVKIFTERGHLSRLDVNQLPYNITSCRRELKKMGLL